MTGLAGISRQGHGVHPAPEDRHWGLRCAHFKDPDGNVCEIYAPVRKECKE